MRSPVTVTAENFESDMLLQSGRVNTRRPYNHLDHLWLACHLEQARQLNIGRNLTSAEPCIAGYQTGLQDGRGEILRYAIRYCLVFQSVVVMLVV
jgi:hypothetical protein